MGKVAISEEYLTDIANSIREKLDSQDTFKVSEMSEAIDSIETGGGGLDWTALGYEGMPETLNEDYNYSLQVKNNWDSTKTNLNNMFENDKTIKYLPVIDTSKGQLAQYMFSNCINLEVVPKLLFPNIANNGLTYMFQNCSELREVDLSGINATPLTTLKNTFYHCSKLTELDLSSWSTPNLTGMNNTFDGCNLLQKIDMRNFDFTNVINKGSTFNYVPTNCLIIVKDATQKTWFTTNFSSMTNVKTIEEYEAM